MGLRLYVGEKQSLIVQEFETIAKIISMALGGESEANKPPVPKNKDELNMMFASVFG